MTYTTRWAQSWSVLAAVEVGFASLQWSPVVVMLDLLATGACVTICLVIYQERWPPAPPGPPPRSWVDTGRRSLLLTCCVVATSTLTVASPPLALLVVLLATVTSPVVVQVGARRRRLDRGPLDASLSAPPPGAPGPPEPGDGGLRLLDDDQLFRLWRHTFWELGEQPTVDQLARLVALRQSCLDELARRNPSALHAWLDSGARASGGPERFWRRRQDHGEPGEGR
jgi:hypothetical protein